MYPYLSSSVIQNSEFEKWRLNLSERKYTNFIKTYGSI